VGKIRGKKKKTPGRSSFGDSAEGDGGRELSEGVQSCELSLEMKKGGLFYGGKQKRKGENSHNRQTYLVGTMSKV